MTPSHVISETLFPGRDLVTEWAAARPTKSIAPFLRLPVQVDVRALKEIADAAETCRDRAFRDHVAEAFAPQAVHSRPGTYCNGLLTDLCEEARTLQSRLEEERGLSWLEHHKSLSHRQVTRSLSHLDENYNPVIDERNYRDLPSCYHATELDRLRSAFETRVVRMRFTQLGPGQFVPSHIDSSARYALRVIILVQTNDGSYYGARVDGEDREWLLEEGAVYFVNGGYVHWARNDGDSLRRVLIFSLDGQRDLSWIEQKGESCRPLVSRTSRSFH